MQEIRITREAQLPDLLRLARYRRAPELGPRVLFFSGGSALRGVSQQLIQYTHNSIHLVTPFDSGGSSAVLRRAFGMLSVGDLRNRIMALADLSVFGNPYVYELFAHRLPKEAEASQLEKEIQEMVHGEHPLLMPIPNPMRRIIRNHLYYFCEAAPQDFDLRGASLGNLVMAGGYINNRRHIDPVVFMFSKAVEARGVVKPVTGLSYHLGAELEGGEVVVGQHLITQKSTPVFPRRIRKVFLTTGLDSPTPTWFSAKPHITGLIGEADLICYPIGSFFSSVLANLLPAGIGAAVAGRSCAKVYTPNPESDPEVSGWGPDEMVEGLLGALRDSGAHHAPADRLLNLILVDSRNPNHKDWEQSPVASRLGIQVVCLPLSRPETAPLYDPKMYSEALLSLT